MKALILKKLSGSDGAVFNSGDIVDVKNWRNAQKLADFRYIEFIIEKDESVIEKPKAPTKKPAAKKKVAS